MKSFFGSLFKSKRSAEGEQGRDEMPQQEPQPSPSAYNSAQGLQEGDVIGGKYSIFRSLGGREGHGGVHSGMGMVHVALDIETMFNETMDVVALKTFQDRFLQSKEAQDRFKREALAWTRLEKHPYIVQAKWVQELANRLFIVMEYIAPDGEGRNTLSHYLVGRPIELKQALEWGMQFCHAMEYAKEKGVSPHRDIKPDNIMISADGRVKVTDFGLCKIWDFPEDLSSEGVEFDERRLGFVESKGGRIVGTPLWMAPEQFQGKADERSDIYSFGLVLYQMASGEKFPPRERPVSKIDTALWDVIEQSLEERPEDRWGSFRELREQLEGIYKMEIGQKIPPLPTAIDVEAWERNNRGASYCTLGLLDLAIMACREALRIKPDLAEAHANLGSILRTQGHIEEAIMEYREALRIRGNSDIAIKPHDADIHYDLGNALAQIGHTEEAITEYREALRIEPYFTEAYYRLGNALAQIGHTEEAIMEYGKALQIKPDFAEVHFSVGMMLKANGHIEEAITEYREALRIKPDDAEAHCNLGDALRTQGHIEEAIMACREALRIKPDLAEAHANLGAALVDSGHTEEAIMACREALRIKPDLAGAHYNLGVALADSSHTDEAVTAYREALRIKPDFAEAHYNLGVALTQIGHIEEAITEYREAVRIKPDYVIAHNNLGIALANIGRIEEAIMALENFIRLSPPQYAEHVQRVKEVILQLQVKKVIRQLRGNL